MTTYRATVRVEDDTLHTSRPLTAPEQVGDMIDSLLYDMTKDGGGAAGGVVSVEFVIETAGESETPVGDSIAATSSAPLHAATADGAAGFSADEDGTSATVAGVPVPAQA